MKSRDVIELFNTVGVNSKVVVTAAPLPPQLIEPLEPAPANATPPQRELARSSDRGMLLTDAETRH
jgi:hypothetical protein